jgi:hypothetical protein
VERLQEFRFVQSWMILALVAFLWMGLGFPVGAKMGSAVGRRVLKSGGLLLVAGTFVVTVWAILSGELAEFSGVFGMWELAEIVAFVVMFEFIVYFMADRYLEDKADEEERNEVKEVETKDA